LSYKRIYVANTVNKINGTILDIRKVKSNLIFIFEDSRPDLIDSLNEIEKELFVSIKKLKERVK